MGRETGVDEPGDSICPGLFDRLHDLGLLIKITGCLGDICLELAKELPLLL